jgi:anti-anti-sigma factor
MAALFGTLAFGVLTGVMIGIALSLAWLIRVATRPAIPILGQEAGTQVFRPIDEHPEDETIPGITVLRLDGGLFFATSDALEDRLREAAMSADHVKAIVLDCAGMDFIDSQGTAKLREICEVADGAGVTLKLAGVKPAVREVMARDGLVERLGETNIHGNVHRAVQAASAGPADPA